jgi:hypothetical protein
VSASRPADIAGLMKSVLLGAALAALLGCRTTETRGLSSAPPAQARVGTRARTWEVRCAGEVVGLVVLFQERGLARDSVYVVRNPWQQDLGLVDGLGRAFRYVPHLEDPAWVGSGTLALGAERILGAEGRCELVETGAHEALDGDLATLPQDARSTLDASAPELAPELAGAALPDEGLPQSSPRDLSKD